MNGKLEQRLNELLAQIDPPGITSDADLDYSKWGVVGVTTNNAAQATQRARDRRIPRQAGPAPTGATTSTTTMAGTVPGSQPAMAPVSISMGGVQPGIRQSGRRVFHPSRTATATPPIFPTGASTVPCAWTSRPGTVIPVGMTLYVGRDAVAFRARSTSPKADEKRFLISGYGGQLSARGETIELYDDQDNLIDSLTYAGSATDMQNWLRITELMYNPADPTTAELFGPIRT